MRILAFITAKLGRAKACSALRRRTRGPHDRFSVSMSRRKPGLLKEELTFMKCKYCHLQIRMRFNAGRMFWSGGVLGNICPIAINHCPERRHRRVAHNDRQLNLFESGDKAEVNDQQLKPKCWCGTCLQFRRLFEAAAKQIEKLSEEEKEKLRQDPHS